MAHIWKYFFKKSGCTADSIAEIEKIINSKVNGYDKYC